MSQDNILIILANRVTQKDNIALMILRKTNCEMPPPPPYSEEVITGNLHVKVLSVE